MADLNIDRPRKPNPNPAGQELPPRHRRRPARRSPRMRSPTPPPLGRCPTAYPGPGARPDRARIADDNRAKDILLLDLREATPLLDFFVIASASSRRQAYAIASEIDQEMKKIGEAKLGMEGAEEGRWILIDYGDFVVHVFSEDARTYYALEEIWGDAPRVDWRDPARIKAAPAEAARRIIPSPRSRCYPGRLPDGRRDGPTTDAESPIRPGPSVGSSCGRRRRHLARSRPLLATKPPIPGRREDYAFRADMAVRVARDFPGDPTVTGHDNVFHRSWEIRPANLAFYVRMRDKYEHAAQLSLDVGRARSARAGMTRSPGCGLVAVVCYSRIVLPRCLPSPPGRGAGGEGHGHQRDTKTGRFRGLKGRAASLTPGPSPRGRGEHWFSTYSDIK